MSEGSSFVRYGIYVPDHGYAYNPGDKSLYYNLKFTDDPNKACWGMSYVDRKDALEIVFKVQKSPKNKHPAARIVTYTMSMSAEVDQQVPSIEDNFAKELQEYKKLKAKYDAMTGSEVEKVSNKEWNYFKRLQEFVRDWGLGW